MLYLSFLLNNTQKQKLLPALAYFKQHSICSAYEDISALHITLKAISEDNNHKQIIDLMDLWKEQYAQNKSITVVANSFNHFDDNIWWIGMNNSWRLYEIKNEFEQLAKQNNINVEKDKYEYTPHITIAFNVQQIKNDFNPKFLYPIPLEINTIVLWGYDHKIKHVHLSETLYMVDI